MREATITKKATIDMNKKTASKNEYVLKFDTTPENKKNNPSSANLPIVWKRGRILIKKFIILLLVFIFFFTISVVISYNAVFYLFTR
ncbi:MAG: hypothetical protein IKI57_04235 [Clostridia bacterium]|nr:hypothetical protein [Clostridia bacterium]